MKLAANLSSWDRIVRIVIALALLTLGLTGVITGAVAIVAYVIAAVFILTSLVSFCPLYALFGLSTRRA